MLLLRLCSVLFLAFSISCAALNFPIDGSTSNPIEENRDTAEAPVTEPTTTTPASTNTDIPTSPTPTPTASASASAVAPNAIPKRAPEKALAWNDLTRLARDHQLRGELAQARERLAQAAEQVRDLPTTHARRQTVFGLRARLAVKMSESGDLEGSDELADMLLTEAEASPELGRAALISLAISVAERRRATSIEMGEPNSQLPLLALALSASESGPSHLDRIDLAGFVAITAQEENQLPLARNAIDLALADARHLLGPNKLRMASLESLSAQIALSAGNLTLAHSAATAANINLTEINASASLRGTAEAMLAEILAEQGDAERSLAIVQGAHARISGEEPIHDDSKRRILASYARVERIAGRPDSARQFMERALAIPTSDVSREELWTENLRLEFHSWEDPAEAGKGSSATSGTE